MELSLLSSESNEEIKRQLKSKSVEQFAVQFENKENLNVRISLIQDEINLANTFKYYTIGNVNKVALIKEYTSYLTTQYFTNNIDQLNDQFLNRLEACSKNLITHINSLPKSDYEDLSKLIDGLHSDFENDKISIIEKTFNKIILDEVKQKKGKNSYTIKLEEGENTTVLFKSNSSSEISIKKLPLKLSVDNLALLFRFLYESDMFFDSSVQKADISRFLSGNFRTKGAENISVKSLRNRMNPKKDDESIIVPEKVVQLIDKLSEIKENQN